MRLQLTDGRFLYILSYESVSTAEHTAEDQVLDYEKDRAKVRAEETRKAQEEKATESKYSPGGHRFIVC